MKFWAMTASLIPMDYDLFYEEGRERDPLLLRAALIAAENTFDPISKIRLGKIQEFEGNLIGLYTKPETAHLYDSDFRPYEQKTFPPRVWIWDQSEQLLLMQIDKSIFNNAESASRNIEKLLKKFLAEHQLELQIYPKVSEESFWLSIEKLDDIQEIRFELATPNIFGSSKEETRKLLATAREDSNATSVTTILKNPKGNIHPKKKGTILRALDWIRDGGGRWLLKGTSPHSGKKITLQSGENAKVFETPENLIPIDTPPSAIHLHSTLRYLNSTQRLSFKQAPEK